MCLWDFIAASRKSRLHLYMDVTRDRQPHIRPYGQTQRRGGMANSICRQIQPIPPIPWVAGSPYAVSDCENCHIEVLVIEVR